MNTNEIKQTVQDVSNTSIDYTHKTMEERVMNWHKEWLDGDYGFDFNKYLVDKVKSEIDLALESRNREVEKDLKEILQACQEDVNFGASTQQMVSTKGQAKCLEKIYNLTTPKTPDIAD
jgi:hypothetical protein